MTGGIAFEAAETIATDAPDDIFEVALPPQPYPGLRPFEKDEWPVFFGREIIAGAVIERLIDQQFLALHGDSGCGKSSLIRAGVMPRLERDHARGGATWRTTSMLPRNAPLRNLAAALAALDAVPPDPARVTVLRRTLNLGTEAAPHLSSQLRRGDNDYICILVDQFEEIFHFAEQGGVSEVQQFVDVLVGLQHSRPPGLHVILTMRSEFLGRCARVEGLAEAINDTQFLLPRMDMPALMRAIREPARLYGGTVDRNLAEAIVADSGHSQDQLPLMQHAMMLMQRQATGMKADGLGWRLTLKAYRTAGGVAELLSEHADGVFSDIAAHLGDEVSTTQILTGAFKALTDINTDGHAIRRPQTIGELMAVTGTAREALLRVLSPLCAEGVSFLKIFGQEPYGESELVDISHEALARNWNQLVAWTRREAEDGVIYRRLLSLTEEHRGDPSILLGVREARDRDRWWHEVMPSQAWADRYSHNNRDITVADVRALIDRSLDPDVQAFSFWREQMQIARVVWEKERRTDALLQGHTLSQAEHWVHARGDDITGEDRAFIEASLTERDCLIADGARERQRRDTELAMAKAREEIAQVRADGARRAMRLTLAGLVVALLLAVVAGISGFEAYRQRNAATHQTAQAVLAREEALRARDDARTAQSRFLADLAIQRVEQGDAVTGMLLALAALPIPGATRRPYVPEAEQSLYAGYFARRELAVLQGHTRPVISAAFSPDGARIVSASDDNTVRLWDAATGKQTAVLQGHTGQVVSAALSPDGARIVSASGDTTVRLWDTATGKATAVLRGHTGPVTSAAFSPDGARIVSASDDNTVRLWDAATGKETAVLQGHTGPVFSAAFSPDGARIVSASSDRTVRLWDTATSEQTAVLQGHTGLVISAAFSPDGARIVSASFDGTVRLWNAATGKQTAVLPGHTDPVYSAAFSPDGTRIVSASNDETVRLWDAATGKQTAVLQGHIRTVNSAAFSPDGARIVSASDDNTVRLWDAAAGKATAVLRGHTDTVSSAAFSPDGARIVSASYDNTVRLWDAATSKETAVLQGHTGPVSSAAFSPDGARVVSASYDKTVRLWDAATGKATAVLPGHTGSVFSAAFSADGTRIVSASSDKTVRLWDAATGKATAVLPGHTGSVFSAAFSPDGARIVSASDDKTVRLWDAATGKETAVLQGHTGPVSSVAFSPDGARIVSASFDETVRLWDAATGKQTAVLQGHTGSVKSAAFSPDGARIASAYSDQTVRLWDAATGKAIAVLQGHAGPVSSVAFSPDGARIVSASDDNTVRLWDIFPTTNALFDQARRIVPRCLTQKQVAEYLLSAEPPIWCVTGPGLEDEADPARWRPKWPHHTPAWRDWLMAHRRGETLPLPKED